MQYSIYFDEIWYTNLNDIRLHENSVYPDPNSKKLKEISLK